MKEKTKMILKFLAIVLACGVMGFFVGGFLAGTNIDALSMSQETVDTMTWVSPILMISINLVLFLCSEIICRITAKRLKADPEEDELDKIEYPLNIPLLLSNIAMVLNFFLFALCVYMLECSDLNGGAQMLLSIAAFVLGYVWIIVVQSQSVSLVEKINPEKKGFVLDTRFQKKWMESCDEAQKLSIYQAGFKAFRAANLACLIAWFIGFCGIFMLGSGILPVLLTCGIHMTLVVSYVLAAMKLERPAE